MDSLKAFLSTCVVVDDEIDLRIGELTLLLRNGQPVQIFDRFGQAQPFQVIAIADSESLTKEDVATLISVAEQTKWIVIVDHSNQVCGVVEPPSIEELQIAASVSIQKGELGTAITPPPPSRNARPSQPNPSLADHPLRTWWRQVLISHRSYQCYAFFLYISSDKNAIEYITGYGNVLDQLSGENCLIITLNKTGVRRSHHDKVVWNFPVKEQISEGFSMTVANLFNIKRRDFPCIVLFENMHSPKRVIFSFNGVEVERINSQMKDVFDIVDEAVANGKSPVSALKHHQGTERLKKVSQSVFSELFGFAKKTFEFAVEALIKTWIK